MGALVRASLRAPRAIILIIIVLISFQWAEAAEDPHPLYNDTMQRHLTFDLLPWQIDSVKNLEGMHYHPPPLTPRVLFLHIL